MIYKLDPNYKSLSRIKKWDNETQEVIKSRLDKESGEKPEKFQFLTLEEGIILKKLIDILLPASPAGGPGAQNFVKIANSIDHNLSFRKKGVKYGLDLWAGHFYKRGLALLKEKNIQDADKLKAVIEGSQDDFLTRFVKRVLSDAVSIYYSHPASWDKIGFPGPAYPEGYGYLKCGQKEDWEPEYKLSL